MSPSGSTLAVYGQDQFGFFDISGPDWSPKLVVDTDDGIYGCCFLDEETAIVCGSQSIRRANSLGDTEIDVQTVWGEPYGHFYSPVAIPSRRLYAVTTGRGEILWHRMDDNSQVGVTQLPKEVISVAARRSALHDSASDEIIEVFERNPASLGTPEREFLNGLIPGNHLTFATLNGAETVIATIGGDGSVFLVDVESRELFQALEDPTGTGFSGEGVCFLDKDLLCALNGKATAYFFRPAGTAY